MPSPLSSDPWINAAMEPSALSGVSSAGTSGRLGGIPIRRPSGAGDPTRLQYAPGYGGGGGNNPQQSQTQTTPRATGTIAVITPTNASSNTPPTFVGEGRTMVVTLPDGTDLSQMNTADVLVSAASGIETIDDAAAITNETSQQPQPQPKPQKKITKNLTPYAIGIGLIVVLIIAIKVLKNDKKK